MPQQFTDRGARFVSATFARRWRSAWMSIRTHRAEGSAPSKWATGNTGEIAAAVTWICSDASSFVTGQSLATAGGYVAH